MEKCSSTLIRQCLILSVYTIILTSCSPNTDFSGRGQQGAEPPPAEPTASGDSDSVISPPPTISSEVFREQFNLQIHKASELDLIWVVDNSGSMEDEINQVRLNFKQFVESLSQDIDLKLALISNIKSMGGQIFGLSIPEQIPPKVEHLQIDRYVDSYDSLELAAYASCPEETSAENRLCNKAFVKIDPASGLTVHASTHRVKGTLYNFYRPNAKRIYVFVSDDEARYIDASNFLSYLTPYLNGSDASIYAFVGIPSVSRCSIENPGNSYIQLAKVTGGQYYDLCEQNWSQHFSALTADVKSKIKNEFRLKATPNRILSIKVNNTSLTTSEYTLTGNVLRINPNQTSINSGTLTVEYN